MLRRIRFGNIRNGTYILWKEGLDQLEQFIGLNLNWGTTLINEFNTNRDPERKHLFSALIKNHLRACLISEEMQVGVPLFKATRRHTHPPCLFG